jgi:hypothetical protein
MFATTEFVQSERLVPDDLDAEARQSPEVMG